MKNIFLLTVTLLLFFGCDTNDGIQMIEIDGGHKVWTKKIGNNPDIKLLLLHGGPGATHEYFKILDQYLPQESIEYYYYDQFGSFNSDPSNNPRKNSRTFFWLIKVDMAICLFPFHVDSNIYFGKLSFSEIVPGCIRVDYNIDGNTDSILYAHS